MKKISIICVTRNDEYGNHQDLRTKVFFNSLNQINNKELYELVLVDWNPPSDRLPFHKQYEQILPKGLSIKIVTVPSTVHNTLMGSSFLKLFEYYGKNVGARHSSGSYLIFTNPDNFFFPNLWEHIENNMSENTFLRLCRLDVNIPYPGYINVDTIDGLTLMDKPKHFYYVPLHTLNTPKEYLSLSEGFEWATNHEGAAGDFLGVSKNNFEKINAHVELYTYGGYDSIIIRDLIELGLKQYILPTISIHIDHSRSRNVVMRPTDVDENHEKNINWGLLGNNEISIIEL